MIGPAISKLTASFLKSSVNRIPIDCAHVGIDVLGTGGLEVEVVSVLIDIHRQEEGVVPGGECVLAIADVRVDSLLFVVVAEEYPAAASHAG